MNDQEWLEPVTQHLDQAVHPGDEARLTRIRAHARQLAEDATSSRVPLWQRAWVVSSGGAFALCAILGVLWLQPQLSSPSSTIDIAAEHIAADDTMFLIADNASLELYEDLDFMLWLADQPTMEAS